MLQMARSYGLRPTIADLGMSLPSSSTSPTPLLPLYDSRFGHRTQAPLLRQRTTWRLTRHTSRPVRSGTLEVPLALERRLVCSSARWSSTLISRSHGGALAEAYTFAADFPPSSALPLAPLELQQRISRAALRAFELAPDAPETLRSAGMVSMQNRDWAEAERRLRRAVELAGPYDFDANFRYAWFLVNVGRVTEAIPYEERAMRAEPLLMRPVAFLAALHEMRGDCDKAEALLQASVDRRGDDALRKQALIMVHLARGDRSALRRLLTDDGERPCPLLDNPQQALEELHQSYTHATRSGAHGQLIPVALFAAFLAIGHFR